MRTTWPSVTGLAPNAKRQVGSSLRMVLGVTSNSFTIIAAASDFFCGDVRRAMHTRQLTEPLARHNVPSPHSPSQTGVDALLLGEGQEGVITSTESWVTPSPPLPLKGERACRVRGTVARLHLDLGGFDDRAPFGDLAGDEVAQFVRGTASRLHVEAIEIVPALIALEIRVDQRI